MQLSSINNSVQARVPLSAIEVSIISRPGAVLNHKIRVKPRLGSEAFKRQKLNLGTHAAAQHYLDRLRAHIEPNWRRLLTEAFARKEAKFAECFSTLHVDADAKGTVESVILANTTCTTPIDKVAKQAIYYAGLLPPPSKLLVNGKLYLEWTFKLTKDD